MEEKDYIKDLFSEKLGNQSAKVNPELWTSISSKIATNAVVTSGVSLTSKLLIGLGTAASITVATIFLTHVTKEDVKTVSKSEKQINPNQQAKKELAEEIKTVAKETKVNSSHQSITAGPKQTHLEYLLDRDFDNDEVGFVEKNNILIANGNENRIIFQDNIEKKLITNNTYLDKKETIEIPETKIESTVERKSDVFIGELPNVFTPNNDRENDIFSIEIKGLSDFSISILDKNNKVVFSSSDVNFKWDGKDFSENMVPAGSYLYFFSGMDTTNKVVSKSSVLKVEY